MKNLSLALLALLMLSLVGCGTNSFTPPPGFSVTARSANILLTWKPISNTLGYNVYRSTVSGPLSSKARIATGLSLTTFVDTGATPGVTYFYQVTGFNAAGDSSPSPEISATIKAAPVADVLLGGELQGAPLSLSFNVSTLAGSGASGAADGTGSAASFSFPAGIATDGKNLFVADTFGNTIRKVVIATGAVTTLAGASASGSLDGIGTAARFNTPYGITIANDGSALYISDFANNSIRSLDLATGTVATLAGATTAGSSDGIGAAASFKGPRGITTDGANLYVADSGNHAVRKIVIATRVVTTLAGSAATSGTADNNGTSATFNTPDGIATDGTSLYLADSAANNVRRINIASQAVTTMAGSTSAGAANGVGTAATFNAPSGITTDGTTLYVADSKNNLVRTIDIVSGAVATVAGSGSAGHADGIGAAATFSQPTGITTDGIGLFIADFANSSIREII